MSDSILARNNKPQVVAYKNAHKHPLSNTWRGMIGRCNNPNDVSYHNYGGRGIKVCDRWHNFEKFTNDVGIRPNGTTLDRIDVNGNYEPDNVRWATAKEQATNRRKGLKRLFTKPKSTYNNNRSGRTGVYLINTPYKPWRSRITYRGKTITKSFNTFEEAVEFRNTMENKLYSGF